MDSERMDGLCDLTSSQPRSQGFSLGDEKPWERGWQVVNITHERT